MGEQSRDFEGLSLLEAASKIEIAIPTAATSASGETMAYRGKEQKKAHAALDSRLVSLIAYPFFFTFQSRIIQLNGI